MGEKFKRSCIVFVALVLFVSVFSFASCGANKDVEKEEYFVKGIDVSEHQGTINASKVTEEVVVIRLGYSGYGSGKCVVDSEFVENINKFASKDCTIALYWASHSITTKEVNDENEFIINILSGLSKDVVDKVGYLFIDREQSGTNEGRADNLSKSDFNKVLEAQVNGLQKKLPNMKIGIYTNVDYLANMIDYEAIGDVPFWIAWYNYEEPTSFESVINRVAENSTVAAKYLEKNIVMWQYSDKGEVSGISRNVDLNLVSYKMLG